MSHPGLSIDHVLQPFLPYTKFLCALVPVPLELAKWTRVSLVAAKTRVNPVKRLSLLRFERIGTLAAARLNRFVQEGLQLDNAPLHAGVAVRSRWHGCGRRLAGGVRVLETLSGKSNPDDLLIGGASLKRLARSSY
ncbi:hypothetical protein T4D_9002 [Trichinella pseudospiralis]|uniref:Uncharacterized protein n=1 Tax=Trichinella pseudospiralis TaxID=6337 RepID=A0A0V1F6F9_TRIPS|nr:hypothetical protein T4D_6906 [Trichinella pseudospiralis]KRY81773.1 hypothetical protein T4D_9002 [Trichinella pseudospiralis]